MQLSFVDFGYAWSWLDGGFGFTWGVVLKDEYGPFCWFVTLNLGPLSLSATSV
jgi:hypothetical protein